MRTRLASGNARNSLILSERFFSCLVSFLSCSCYNGEGQSTTGAMVRLLILNSIHLYSSVRLTHTGRIVALFVIFGVLAIAFAGVQFWKGDDATVPPRILKQRSIAFGCWYIFCLGGSFFVRTYISLIITSIMQVRLVGSNWNIHGSISFHAQQCHTAWGSLPLPKLLTLTSLVVYYIPIWFQAIKGASAVDSGIRCLPMILGVVILSIVAGLLITALGYYTPWMILSSLLMATGAGLLSTFRVGTGHAMWIGYQAIYGLGVGAGMQQGAIAAQTVCTLEDIPTATGTF